MFPVTNGAGELENRHLTDWHVPEAKAAVLSAVEAVMEQGQDLFDAFLAQAREKGAAR